MKNNEVEEEANVFDLILKLREEKLFVKCEKKNIQELNELVRKKAHQVIKSTWITNKQRLMLCQREFYRNGHMFSDFLQRSEFVEAKNVLGFQQSVKIANLLHILRSQPKQLAKWLIAGEHVIGENLQYSLVLHSIVNGLYGSFLFPEDTKYMLTLLYELSKLQLLNSDHPRRIIKQRTCSFRHLYFLFHEVLQATKFFLSAALEVPIFQLMSHTEYYLDLDPGKSVMRFEHDNDSLCALRDAVEYRNQVVSKLAEFTNNFLSSILTNIHCFPKSIAWIVYHISKMMDKTFSPKEVNAITTELIFTLFICPVIIDPEQYGICSSQVTDMARHNLIQVGKILQILALQKYEPVDKKYTDIFNLLDKNCMCNFFDLLFFDLEGSDPPIDTAPEVSRDIMLFTEQELNNLISFLQTVQTNRTQNDKVGSELPLNVSIEEQVAALSLSRDNSPVTSTAQVDISNDGALLKKNNFFSLGSRSHISRSVSDEFKTSSHTVLIFPIDRSTSEPVGFLPEDKVIDLTVPDVKSEEIFLDTSTLNAALPETTSNTSDMKPQFFDEGSIGNTSDNLEAISEAASNHSVASSLELENEDQNDNLSDMVSANVSGRGTPNISGRDTPSSQVNENEPVVNVENRQENNAPPPQSISRQIRSDIDDKFCKFEIKKLLEGDETISLISETWSTDVLASDNEALDTGDLRERQMLPLVDQVLHEVPVNLDISETQSESAWSTDVVTSDTERLTEVDNDDAGSVGQSDDANSVARSDDTRSETDEVVGVRRLSTSSNSQMNQSYVASISLNNTSYVNIASNSATYVKSNTNSTLNYVTTTNNYVMVNQNYATPNVHEFKKVEFKTEKVNGKIYSAQIDNNANTVFKSLSESSQQNFSFPEPKPNIPNGRIPNCKEDSAAGPSGLNKSESFSKQRNGKLEDRPTEILLSNCSLNSSSSGSSSNSFENKTSNNENSEQWESKPWLNSSGSSLNVTLTPSESTSEMSVLSVNNGTNAGNHIKKTSTLLSNRVKPSVSTGAIPKSISFDMSADKGLDDDHRSKRGGFFVKLRNIKIRRGKPLKSQEEFRSESDEFNTRSGGHESPAKISNTLSDDILAKYRTNKSFVESPVKENSETRKSPKDRRSSDSSCNEVNSFSDIKKKLRLVLSNTSEIPFYIKNNPISIRTKIEMVLRLELGKARKLKEWSSVARISEAIRCINLLNDTNCLKLLQSMKEDLLLRSTYIRYLVSSKQELLFCDMYLSILQDQITHDKEQCEKYFAAVYVREFLTGQEGLVNSFCDEFQRLHLADEKCDYLQNFYKQLYSLMNANSLCQGVLQNRESLVRITLERFIMNKVYTHALYPNGDGDCDRDRVLKDHIEKLSKIISPHHKDLLIQKVYLRESPWLPAQDALRALNATRTPRDKVKCILRCAKCIMDLLSLSQTNGSTTADDFTPVLVYVIIKVNPEALLSTIQFVSSFHNQLYGEEEYWWTQFCSAVEFIKTMDYSD